MNRKQNAVWLFALPLAVWLACVALLFLQAVRIDALLPPRAAADSNSRALLSLAAAGSLLVGVGVVSTALYVLFLKPIHELVAMASAVGAGNFRTRLGWKRRDDIGRLAFEMDTLCDQLEAARNASDAHIEALEQLRHTDRVATLGRLASSVAHELGNPLNVVEMRAQLIVAGDITTLEGARQNAAIIVAQARRMTGIISEILSFARRQPPHVAALDLVHVVRSAIALSEHTAKKRGLAIQFDATSAAIEVEGDADKLLQIVVNLVLNSVQATERGGVVCVGVRRTLQAPDKDPGAASDAYVCIDVIDRGAGIPGEWLAKIFEPFFSSKSAGEGTGLGLSVAQGIAKEHGGWIDVDSELGRGSHFTVYLPRDGKRDAVDD